MNIKYPDSLRTSNGDTDVMQSVSKQLEEMAGNSIIPASAEWEIIQDQSGHRRYNLKLSDYLGQVSGEFTVAEMHSPRQMRRHLMWPPF